MHIGYCRVSSIEQNLDLQKRALRKAGCKKIFGEKISSIADERVKLIKIKEVLRKGDTLVVWRLDRLGRSLKDLIEWMNYLEKKGIGFKSLQESINTKSSSGKLVFHLFAALAEFERNLIVERTHAGLKAARARGRFGGRPKRLDKKKRKIAVELYNQRQMTVKQICDTMGISKPTLYAYIKELKSDS